MTVAAAPYRQALLAEMALAVILFGEPVGSFIASLGTPPGALGLAGQAVFALFPALMLSNRQ